MEDRILSLCMLFRTYKLKTICISKSTFSYEPMMTWTNLLNQRKRWINGTISTYIYYLMTKQGEDELNKSILTNKNYLKLLLIQPCSSRADKSQFLSPDTNPQEVDTQL